ncbi:MAG TPA: cofactor-independent phosphoglycerate mutase [Kiritimatiellia bacterium]|nr:cofactor-independent phosphoglycerate mutase [Kiritimatiellia bacterium]
MKLVYLVGDGMGDNPVDSLGGKTILQAANIPTMRKLAAAGTTVLVDTVPITLAPGSDVANLSLLGYDPSENYTGRAPIEAAGAGIPLQPDDVAVRCNLVTVRDGRMDDYSAGHISTEDAHALIATLQKHLGNDHIHFHGGISYRHLIVWKNGPTDVNTQPPHDISGQRIDEHLPSGPDRAALIDLMERSKTILADHPVNRARIARGEAPATQIWLWGQGRAMTLPSYQKKFGRTGAIISAVDLVRGLGILAGLDAPRIPGATGFLDTNYQGKVDAALQTLEHHNFAYLHIEAPDECGHMGDAALKKQAVEDFEANVVLPVWQALEARGEPYRIILAMDHRTPVATRAHTRDPVPVSVIDGPTGPLNREAPFDEFICGGTPQGIIHQWIAPYLKA